MHLMVHLIKLHPYPALLHFTSMKNRNDMRLMTHLTAILLCPALLHCIPQLNIVVVRCTLSNN